jgi:hypothetical protein
VVATADRPNWLTGAWDWYCHSAPCQMPRWGNATQVAREARAAGFAGIVLQTHSESTTGRASAAGEAVPQLSVLGGITLNEFAAGISAKSVRAQIAAGAAFVWLPTIDALAHISALGGAGRTLSGVHDPLDRTLGITILDPHRRVTRDAMAVIDAVADRPVFIGTGHLSLDEVTALVVAAAARSVPIVINHPYFLLHPDAAWWRQLPPNAVVQFAALADSSNPVLPPIERVLEVIELIGPERCAIGSETKAVNPVDAIVTFGRALMAQGLDEQSLRTILTHDPRRHLERGKSRVDPRERREARRGAAPAEREP